MKNRLPPLLLITAIIACNSTIQRSRENPDTFTAVEKVDSGTLTILQILFREYPRGGVFSGHPAIYTNGNINRTELNKDLSLARAKGILKVAYNYRSKFGDSITIWKNINF